MKPPRFCAALSYLYADTALPDAYALAREAGFEGVELALPYGFSPQVLARAAEMEGLPTVLFTAPLGDFLEGGEGLAAVPGRQREFRESLAEAREYASALGCDQVQVLAGRCLDDRQRDSYLAVLAENLEYACEVFQDAETRVVLEPINNRDFPAYLLSTPGEVWSFLDRMGLDEIGVVLDTAHLSAMGIDVCQELADRGSGYCHIQLADGPERCAPGSGELDFSSVAAALGRSDYSGWLGLEYRASSREPLDLDWLAEFRRALEHPGPA